MLFRSVKMAPVVQAVPKDVPGPRVRVVPIAVLATLKPAFAAVSRPLVSAHLVHLAMYLLEG